VRGRITRTGMYVDGAIVLLVDAAGLVVARGASAQGGTFSVAAPRAGRYTLRVLRIGLTPTIVGPVDLAAGVATPVDVNLSGKPVALSGMQIVDRAACDVRPDSDAIAFRLWDEARKALLGTALTQGEQLTMRVSKSERTLGRDGRGVENEKSEVSVIPTVRPFASLPPDSLASAGYVQRNAQGEIMFWAPDADVLLSETFAASHCLRPERARVDTGRAAQWIGIAFQPSSSRGVADVSGVLWLDKATAELRELEYRYANMPEFSSLAERAEAGGRLEFVRLPTGGWIIPRWSIRYPVIRKAVQRTMTEATPFGRPTAAVELAGVQVSAGEVSEVRRGGATIWERGRVGYRVRLIDGERRQPVAGGIVVMDDAADTLRSGADGTALFERVLPGAHRLSVRTQMLDLLGAPPATIDVSVTDSQAEPRVIELPSERAALERACGGSVAARREAVLRGAVRGTAPLANTPVEAAWQASFTRLGGGAPLVVPRRARTTTDARGEFVLCGVPRGVPITLRALRARRADAPLTVVVPPSAPAMEQRLVLEP
jgi:hypothetical protein